MWIHRNTVSAISSYRPLMMRCRAWEGGGQPGRLITEDYLFQYYTMKIFGKQWKKMVEEVTERYQFEDSPHYGEPWLIDMSGLSLKCLENTQNRLFSEIKSPNWFRIKESVRSRNLKALLRKLPKDEYLRHRGTDD